MHDIESKVIKLTSETLKIDEGKISVESNFVNDLGADSLDQVELMMAIEAAFGYDIPDEDATKILTVKDAATYIKSKIDSNAPQVTISSL